MGRLNFRVPLGYAEAIIAPVLLFSSLPTTLLPSDSSQMSFIPESIPREPSAYRSLSQSVFPANPIEDVICVGRGK